jgi:hypothetical protein
MSNRTKTFAQYLTAYQRFTGTETMDATNTAVATLAFTRNMRRGWESWQWPWADVTEERTLDVNNRIEYDQTGENRIAEVFAVYNTDPQSSTGAYTISYTLDQDGILFGGANIPTTAYVYYRKDCPDYYGTPITPGPPTPLATRCTTPPRATSTWPLPARPGTPRPTPPSGLA